MDCAGSETTPCSKLFVMAMATVAEVMADAMAVVTLIDKTAAVMAAEAEAWVATAAVVAVNAMSEATVEATAVEAMAQAMVTKATAAVEMAAVLVAKAMVEAMAVANTVKVLQTGEAARHGLRGCASAHAVYYTCIYVLV